MRVVLGAVMVQRAVVVHCVNSFGFTGIGRKRRGVRMKVVIYLCAVLILAPAALSGQRVDVPVSVEIVHLQYITPIELMEELTAQYTFDGRNEVMINGSAVHFTINNATNQVMLTGDANTILSALQLIKFLDVPSRQIVIEAKIVEINNEKLSELGMDWQYFLDRTEIHSSGSMHKSIYETVTDGITDRDEITNYQISNSVGNYMKAGDFLKIIQEKEIGRVTNVPTIVTTNNKEGTILDGSRVTYVTRYSSNLELFETQEMTAGLFLSVIPSLGESGYLKLQITAKLTELGQIISGSPSETGQIIENTVIVKDGEEFILGGFKTTEKSQYKRKVPVLGTILPFLFSRTENVEILKDFLIILKPAVIDLNPIEIPEIE
jgi:type II secretory pathway component GspD/PulD (secretin)